MTRRFSSTFPTFEAWLSVRPSRSPYAARIARTHARYPTATLGQLRRHPGARRPALSRVPRAPTARLPVAQLSHREQLTRRRALEVVSEARRGKGSLSKLARARGMSSRTVRRASGAFRKQGGRWVPTRSDRVERWLKSYENGQRVEVLIRDSRTATLLSRYSNAVGHYIETGDARGFREFEGKTYRDAAGTVHTFETDPAAIRAAIERSESDFGAFADLYAEPEGAEEFD
jgi:AraC-like DNA-binding protein